MNRKVAYVTDIHLDEDFPIKLGINTHQNWNKILEDISSRGINDIVFGGDIGEKTSNKLFFDSLRSFNIAVSLGNHDDYSEAIKHYKPNHIDQKSGLYYTQEFELYKCIFLDSSSETVSQEQFDWFKEELISTKDIVLFVHHPILPIESEVDKRYYLEGRNQLKSELLNIENNVTIFCGHYHFNDEKTEGNILQYVTPAASFQVAKLPNEIKVSGDEFGYRIIEMMDNGIDTELVMFSKEAKK